MTTLDCRVTAAGVQKSSLSQPCCHVQVYGEAVLVHHAGTKPCKLLVTGHERHMQAARCFIRRAALLMTEV